MFNDRSPLGVSNMIMDVLGVPTWVSYIEAENKSQEENFIALVIPGNPGPIGFYESFIASLYECSNKKISIYGISHAGHHFINCNCNEEEKTGISICENFPYYCRWRVFSLHDQIDHKLFFVYNCVPRDSKLILIGHSIGAYIALAMMGRLSCSERVVKAVLLFPTIENIAKTSSGLFWTTMTWCMAPLLLFASWLFSSMPMKMQLMLITAYMTLNGFCKDENSLNSIISFLNYHGMSNALQIARDIIYIKDLDQESVIQENINKLTFYYGTKDPWAPISFQDKMKERFPACDIRLCEKSFEHAFVLHSAKDVGSLTHSLINDVL